MTFPAQTHWHEPTGGKRAGFGKFGRPKTPYDLFMESEGIPVFRDIGVSKVQNLPLAPWKRIGGRGTYIQLHGTEGKWGCYVVEVPGAGALNPEKHMYEEIYLRGRRPRHRPRSGSTATASATCSNGRRARCSRSRSTPCTASSTPARRPALLLGGTTAPNLMNLINNVGAIFDNPYQFRDRFSGADDFYKYKDDIEPDPVRGLAMRRTNFVPDIVNCDLPLDNRRSPGYPPRRAVHDRQHVLSLDRPARERPLLQGARAHLGGGADLHQGQGLHLHWPERSASTRGRTARPDQVKRVDYEPVGMVSAAPGGARWFHQHFGASKEPLRLTAWFGPHNPGREPGPPGEKHIDYTAMDIPEGGSAIPYWMEDPYIKKEYDERLSREGVENRMRPEYYDKNYKGELPKE